MSGWVLLYIWIGIGFFTCVWSIWDDLKEGKDFDLHDALLIIPTSLFGPIFTIYCINLCWKRSGVPVIIRARKKDERGRND